MGKLRSTVGLLIASLSLLPAVTVQAATRSAGAVRHWGEIRVDHALWRTVPYLTYQGTSYVGLWYVMQLLQQNGVSTKWDGQSLSVNNLPAVNGGVTTTVDGKSLSRTGSLTVGGSSYLDLSAVAKAYGWPLHYNAAKRTITLGVKTSGKSPSTTTHFLSHSSLRLEAHPATKTPSVPQNPRVGTQAISLSPKWAPINGGKSISVLTSGGTSYVGIWYLLQYLQGNGYDVSWNDGTLSVGSLPNVVLSGAVGMGDNIDTTVMAQYRGDWYVPLSTLMYTSNVAASVDPTGNLHVRTLAKSTAPVKENLGESTSVTVQLSGGSGPWTGAKVAVVDRDGVLHVTSNTTGTSTINITFPGPSAQLIGLYTPAVGWVGQAMVLDKSSTSVMVSTDQALATLSGQVSSAQTASDVAGSTIELRSDLTHVHYFVKANAAGAYHVQVPVGPYEIWTVTVGGKPVFVGQRFLAKPGEGTIPTIRIPTVATTGEVRTAHADVVAQAADVSPLQLVSIANMFERILPYDTATTGIAPQLPIRIQVYEKQAEYTQHFFDQDYSIADAQSIGQYSQAVSEGPQDISVNLDGLTHEFGVDVLAHEFTHSLIDNISLNIPSWVNEGIAWHQGIGAELDISPSDVVADGLQWTEWEDIVNHQYIGDLYPLGGADALAPKYNVEAQDYFAVEWLIQQYGEQKVIDYVKQIDALGSDNAFQKTFHESISSFANQVTNRLKTISSRQDTGMVVTLRMLPGSPSQVFISNPTGKTYWFTGAKPGNVYTFTLGSDGSVTGPSTLTGQPSTSSSSDGTWDVGTQSGASQGFFALDDSYGLAYLQSQDTFFGTSATPEVQIASELPFGVQLVSVVPKTLSQ